MSEYIEGAAGVGEGLSANSEPTADSHAAEAPATDNNQEHHLPEPPAEIPPCYQELFDKLQEEYRNIEQQKSLLAKREQAVLAAEIARDEGYADERAKLDLELAKKKADAIAEREKALTDFEKKARDDFERDRAQLAIDQGTVDSLMSDITRRSTAIAYDEEERESREAKAQERIRRRNSKLDAEVDRIVEQTIETYEKARQQDAADRDRLLDSIRVLTEKLSAYEELEIRLGGKTAEEVISKLNAQEKEITELRDRLPQIVEDDSERLIQEYKRDVASKNLEIQELRKAIDESKDDLSDYHLKKWEADEARRAEERANTARQNAEDDARELAAQLKQLRATYETPEEWEQRVKAIEKPALKREEIIVKRGKGANTVDFRPKKYERGQEPDEIAWLNGIMRECANYGLSFNERLVKSFHTSLKTAEWSPLTVLAGVSGTGKSELPRLYAHFGGLFFHPLSVQPNWDSKESMLGYFNSIDNKFEAETILRFLAQSQLSWQEPTSDSEGYPGLYDGLCLVLLDEMNLAHPELYFAEFLSKFETRRGKYKDVPALDVKVGAGLDPYPLPLGRNVLWAGTMNQDETTKSLSDKVLDRSIVMYFPRPTKLMRRIRLNPLDDSNRGLAFDDGEEKSGPRRQESIHFDTWASWLADESTFEDDEIEPYKLFVEEMNKHLGIVGRAIGHRVWQSIEYYMANYPGVRTAANDEERRTAMNTAFEDQLVQKIMPKLRGIDTSGYSRTDCLDEIALLLNRGVGGKAKVSFENLSDDFDLACRVGYGQFMWQSANYLEKA